MKRVCPATVFAVLIATLLMQPAHAVTADDVERCAAFGRLSKIIMEKRLDGASPSQAMNVSAPEIDRLSLDARRELVLTIYGLHLPSLLERDAALTPPSPVDHMLGPNRHRRRAAVLSDVREMAEIACFERLK